MLAMATTDDGWQRWHWWRRWQWHQRNSGYVGLDNNQLKASATVVEMVAVVAVALTETVAAVVAEVEANLSENRGSGGGIDSDGGRKLA
jgi:hypothetical protein